MGESNFKEAICNNFNNLKRNFQSGLKNKGYDFDEDLFIDTLLKCGSALKNRDITKSEMIKYCWTAYVNGLKRLKLKEKTTLDIEETTVEIYDIPYNEDIDRIYEIIIKEVKERFEEHISSAWISHVCHNKSYKELESDGYDFKFNYEFKRIMRYIRNNLLKNNEELSELVKNLKDK